MSSIYISFSLKTFSTSMESTEVLEKDYQTVYKPLAKFIYSHPEFCFSFSFTGTQLKFFKKRRNEFLALLRDSVNKKQVEIIGGGYYDPVLPLLYSSDRNGQIDLLSTEIRQTIGKRPRGITLFADCWDASLVNNLQTCGIEYVILDSSIIPPQKRKFLPIIMSDLGKTVEIFPYYSNLVPDPKIEPKEFVENIIHTVEKVERKDTYVQLQPDRIVNIALEHKDIPLLFATGWFDKLSDYLIANPDLRIKTVTPSVYKKNQVVTVPAYITAGINSQIAKWIGRAYTEIDISKLKSQYSVYDFMETYPQSRSLYDRVLYVSMLFNQIKNDKQKKNAARDKLWQAQNGAGLLCTPMGAFSNSKYRQQCYKALAEAEKILQDGALKPFNETINCFDYNCDGNDEYVCRMKNYFSMISLKGGSIHELDVLKAPGNYADNLTRVLEYDNYADDYDRGLFVDHIFSEEQFKNYLKGEPAGNGIFSRIQYQEVRFNASHKEIELYSEALFPPTKQKISLRKKYIVNSDGMSVQYILKNESEKPFAAKFAVESNFTDINFNPEELSYFKLELIDNGKKIEIDTQKPTAKLLRSKQLKNVYLVHLCDMQNGVAFDFEPNETGSYCYFPLLFKRPDFDGKDIVPVSLTYVSSIFWDVELKPGMETEKNINFTISSIKKQKKLKPIE